MPRAPRIDIPGLIYHVTARGVKKLPIFYDDEDRQRFINLLGTTNTKFPFQLHAYCLMTNHYHLLIQTTQFSLSKTMQYFKTLFAHAFNRKHDHVGHVFQGRFHSIPVQRDAYFTTVARYIHLNPVRAGMVSRPEDYPWSNYGRLIQGEDAPLVDTRSLLEHFGRDAAEQRENYKRFVEEAMGKPDPITEQILHRMRFWGNPVEKFALSQKTA